MQSVIFDEYFQTLVDDMQLPEWGDTKKYREIEEILSFHNERNCMFLR